MEKERSMLVKKTRKKIKNYKKKKKIKNNKKTKNLKLEN